MAVFQQSFIFIALPFTVGSSLRGGTVPGTRAAFSGFIFAWILGTHVILSWFERESQMSLRTHVLHKLAFWQRGVASLHTHTHTTETEPRETFGGVSYFPPASPGFSYLPLQQACVYEGRGIEIGQAHGASFSSAESARKHKKGLFCIHYKVSSCARRKPVAWRGVDGREFLSYAPRTESQGSRRLSCLKMKGKWWASALSVSSKDTSSSLEINVCMLWGWHLTWHWPCSSWSFKCPSTWCHRVDFYPNSPSPGLLFF